MGQLFSHTNTSKVMLIMERNAQTQHFVQNLILVEVFFVSMHILFLQSGNETVLFFRMAKFEMSVMDVLIFKMTMQTREVYYCGLIKTATSSFFFYMQITVKLNMSKYLKVSLRSRQCLNTPESQLK